MSSSQKKSLLKKKRSNKILKEKEISPKFKTSPKIKIGQWDEDEDDILNQWVKENGPKNWAKCAKLIKCRTGKQCREHWKNKLNEDIKKGQWTPEDDLLILKFYNKYQSWKQIIPIFDSRTENSIKNRFFSLLRKIAIKKKTFGKTNEVAKMKIDSLKRFLEEAIEQAENIYYYENKFVTKEKFESYINEIENNLKFIRKGKFIDLNSIRKKIFEKDSNIKNINFIKISNSFEKNEKNNKDKNDISNKEKNDDNNQNQDQDYNSDTISYEEDDKKPEIKQNDNTNKLGLKPLNIQESQISLDKNISFFNKFYRDSNSKLLYFQNFPNSFFYPENSKNILKVPAYNPIQINEKDNNNKDILNRRTNSKLKINNNLPEFPLNFKIMNQNTENQLRNDSMGGLNKFLTNTSFRIENIKSGQKIIPCNSFS